MKTAPTLLLGIALAFLLGAAARPAHAGGMKETGVEAQVENGPLRGTLAMPENEPARAAVVIVPGSGPTDRDGNSPHGIDASYLKMLAGALAVEGVASIRIDKRGMFESRGAFSDANAATFADYAGDALAWVEVARKEAETECAWLAGHSEGGLVALLAAQEAGPSLCGLVLLAAPGRPMGTVLAEQLRVNPANAPLLEDALFAIDALERGDGIDVSGFHPALQAMFAPAVQGFLIDAFSHDPAALIANVALPVLIVQGDADIQVSLADAQALSRAQPAADMIVVPGMNHVLKPVPAGDVAANLASYRDPALPLAPGLAQAVADFVTGKR